MDTPNYLTFQSPRILDTASITPMGGEVWFDIQASGMLLRLVLSSQEVDELIEVLQEVRTDLIDG